MTFSGGQFHYATRSYPKLIADDAARWLKAFHATAPSGYQESEGTIAAWAADEELLGRSTLVDQYLDQQATAGHLNGDEVNGHRFVTALRAFLRKLHYIR
jgi:quinol monooxygenase YgiN